MDRLSSKIRIDFEINTVKIDKSLIVSNDRKLLADIEGDLRIWVEGCVFFQDEYILLLEFAVMLTNWVVKIENRLFDDFVYETMDYSEGPILEFKQRPNSMWEINSIWANKVNRICFDLQEITIAAKKFLADFQKDLYKKYLIELRNFTS